MLVLLFDVCLFFLYMIIGGLSQWVMGIYDMTGDLGFTILLFRSHLGPTLYSNVFFPVDFHCEAAVRFLFAICAFGRSHQLGDFAELRWPRLRTMHVPWGQPTLRWRLNFFHARGVV